MKYTVLETGTALYASQGEWNSPKDGLASRPSYWTRLQDGITGDLRLQAGEWTLVDGSALRESIRELIDANYLTADQSSRPWAY
jgi:hypothetical protein